MTPKQQAERTLIVGDIHGHLTALDTVLKNAAYNPQKDRLICLGDYIDGWEQSFQVVERLIEYQEQSPFKNIYLMGNHDKWMCDFLEADLDNWRHERIMTEKHRYWMLNGGYATYQQYLAQSDEAIYQQKQRFFDQLELYFLEDNKLFVHAGFDKGTGFKNTLKYNPKDLYWSRSLAKKAMNWYQAEQAGHVIDTKKKQIEDFDKIYIGHSPTSKYGLYHPVQVGNVINLDQGCKHTGTLSLWIDETDTYIQCL
ncbi:MAG: metallophosphoesterase family protein [Aureispira sp.]